MDSLAVNTATLTRLSKTATRGEAAVTPEHINVCVTHWGTC